MTSDLRVLFKSARLASTPLIAIRTPDAAATVSMLKAGLNGEAPPLLEWDVIRGVQWQNVPGLAVALRVFLGRGKGDPLPETEGDLQAIRDELALNTANLVETLVKSARLPEDTILFLHNAQLFWERPDVKQGVWNLREAFKANGRSLVLLITAGAVLPAELANDVIVFDEPLPTAEQLAELVRDMYQMAGEENPPAPDVERAVDAVCGLAAFPAEQITVMSMQRKDGAVSLDFDALWERKRQMIEATPGLTVWREGATMDQVAGVETAKMFLTKLLQGRAAPRLIVILDEFEKAMAGAGGGDAGGDSSGTSQEMHGTLLTEMENNEYAGMMFVGVAGCTKSWLAKCAGASFGIPTISMDISGMKSKFVGSSNENLRTALMRIKALSQGRALFIATCNGVVNLSGPLKRRFPMMFYFDLPTAEERAGIWKIHTARYEGKGITDFTALLPDDTGWTGAEIRNCCKLAWQLSIPLKEAAQFIIPVARMDAEGIERLRSQATGRWLSASYAGVYKREDAGGEAVALATASGKAVRRIRS